MNRSSPTIWNIVIAWVLVEIPDRLCNHIFWNSMVTLRSFQTLVSLLMRVPILESSHIFTIKRWWLQRPIFNRPLSGAVFEYLLDMSIIKWISLLEWIIGIVMLRILNVELNVFNPDLIIPVRVADLVLDRSLWALFMFVAGGPWTVPVDEFDKLWLVQSSATDCVLVYHYTVWVVFSGVLEVSQILFVAPVAWESWPCRFLLLVHVDDFLETSSPISCFVDKLLVSCYFRTFRDLVVIDFVQICFHPLLKFPTIFLVGSFGDEFVTKALLHDLFASSELELNCLLDLGLN